MKSRLSLPILLLRVGPGPRQWKADDLPGYASPNFAQIGGGPYGGDRMVLAEMKGFSSEGMTI